jgi:uncharacterized membrane protein YeiH
MSDSMWSLPSTDFVLHWLSLVAIAAQAMTAALAAGRRSMDWAGVCMLGCITALGGGTIRDVLLGHYPLVWVQHPSYLLLAAGAALVTILIARLVHRLNAAFLVLDAIGLVVFTMAGCDVAWQIDASLPLVIVVVAGMITGCAGGVLRDILCNDVPLLFRAELYASVSIVTGVFYSTAFGLKLNAELWTALTFVLGLRSGCWRSATNGKCRNSSSKTSGSAYCGFRAFATCAGVTAGAALPQALRI